jgi:hypothetical protein
MGEPLTAKIAEKSREERKDKEGKDLPLCSLRLFFAVLAVKGFSRGPDFTRRGIRWHAILRY